MNIPGDACKKPALGAAVDSSRILVLAALLALAATMALPIKSAEAAAAIAPFSVSVAAKKYSKYGASGYRVDRIRVSGNGVRMARPVIVCDKRFCGRWSKAKRRPARSRLYRSPVVFSNVGWVIANGHGFTVKLMPRSRKRLGLYAVLSPPDALNKRFTISEAGCLSRNGRKADCPPGTVLPTTNYRRAVAPAPVYTPGGDVAAVSYGAGKMMILTTAGDGTLWYRTFESSVWSEWRFVGGVLASAPAATSIAAGRVDVFARNQSNQLVRITYDDSKGWGPWGNLGGSFTGTPSASTWGGSRIDVFVRTAAGKLGQIYSDTPDATWSIWVDLGECLNSSPTAASWAVNRADVFFRGCTSNELGHKWWSDGWSNYESLDGGLAGAPSAVSLATGHLDVYVLALNNRIVHKSFSNGWSAFVGTNSPVVTTGVAAATMSAAEGGKDIWIFSRDAAGTVVACRWNSSTGWGAWESLGS